MDEIQKVLVKLGHKDLAQEYYEKVAEANTATFPCPECGTKVLENTGYCLKCKKKVEKASKKTAALNMFKDFETAKNNIDKKMKILEKQVKQIVKILDKNKLRIVDSYASQTEKFTDPKLHLELDIRPSLIEIYKKDKDQADKIDKDLTTILKKNNGSFTGSRLFLSA